MLTEAAIVALELLKYPEAIVISHTSPDADAIGSLMGITLALQDKGIKVTPFLKDGVPYFCKFMIGDTQFIRELPEVLPPLLVFVDASNLQRCGLSTEEISGLKSRGVHLIIQIDHHFNDNFDSDLAIVDTLAPATAVLIYHLLPLLGCSLTQQIATALLAGLTVDTGKFSFGNTTAESHRIAAALMDAGADVTGINLHLYESMKREAFDLLKCAMNSIKSTADNRLVWAILRAEDYTGCNAKSEDTEGIIDFVRRVDGNKIAILFSERNNVVRVSLRSRGGIDVGLLARTFGGGGHAAAAGIKFENGNLDEIIGKVLDEATKIVKE
ncbi:MAG: DHH family phosphoesterase [bacterium]